MGSAQVYTDVFCDAARVWEARAGVRGFPRPSMNGRVRFGGCGPSVGRHGVLVRRRVSKMRLSNAMCGNGWGDVPQEALGRGEDTMYAKLAPASGARFRQVWSSIASPNILFVALGIPHLVGSIVTIVGTLEGAW